MTYSDIIDKVSIELNLPKELVDRTYKSYWFFIRNYIKSLPLKENINEKDFTKLKTNFNIPSLGKLTCTHDRVFNMKKYFEKNKIKKEKNAKN